MYCLRNRKKAGEFRERNGYFRKLIVKTYYRERKASRSGICLGHSIVSYLGLLPLAISRSPFSTQSFWFSFSLSFSVVCGALSSFHSTPICREHSEDSANVKRGQRDTGYWRGTGIFHRVSGNQAFVYGLLYVTRSCSPLPGRNGEQSERWTHRKTGLDGEKERDRGRKREEEVERLFNGVELVVGMVSIVVGGRSRYGLAAFLRFYAYFERTTRKWMELMLLLRGENQRHFRWA